MSYKLRGAATKYAITNGPRKPTAILNLLKNYVDLFIWGFGYLVQRALKKPNYPINIVLSCFPNAPRFFSDQSDTGRQIRLFSLRC